MSKLSKIILIALLTIRCVLSAQQVNILDKKAEKHIFEGEVKEKNGRWLGNGCHHYLAIQKGTARIIANTEKSGPKGIFKAKVEVYHASQQVWVKKIANGGYSTFFPKDWTFEKTKKEITNAYQNKTKVSGSNNEYKGFSTEGIEIRMYLKDNGKIISAFPADWERH